MATNPENPVILFDGVCNLCERSVQLVIRNDRKRLFRFASLQSGYAQRLLGQHDYQLVHRDPPTNFLYVRL